MKMTWLFAVLLVGGVALGADPAWRKDLTDPAPGTHPRLSPMVLEYKLSWKGMLDAGQIMFVFGKKDPDHPDDFTVHAIGGSKGVAKKMFDYSHDFAALLDPVSLRPKSFTGVETGDGRKTTNRNTYSNTGVHNHGIVCDLASGREFKGDLDFKFEPVLDMFSAMMIIRSKPLAQGDKMSFVIQPFRTPYLLEASVAGREAHEGRDTIKIDVALKKIAADFSLETYEKLKQASLWLSDDEDRIPIDLRTQVFIGDVRMTLTKRTPLK
jgi:hypothetical protein